jgi:hypothetical protein
MQFVADFVRHSATGQEADSPIEVIPFKLDFELEQAPSEFQVVFVLQRVRYQYGFKADSRRVLEEWLYAYPEARPQMWFFRTTDANQSSQSWDFGSHLKGQKQTIKDSTRPNALFLSTGAQLNNVQLKRVWDWFASSLRAFTGPTSLAWDFTTRNCQANGDQKQQIVEFLQTADLGIDDVLVRSRKKSLSDFPGGISDSLRRELMENSPDEWIEPYFVHKRTDGTDEEVAFEAEEESAGTLHIFSWAGPWLDVLANERTLVLDELDSSLHPLLAKHLVKYFHDSASNSGGAQLIFSTHSVSLMNDCELLRRDQVWFAAKSHQGATSLVPYTDFHARKGESRAKNYLGGRYGAIPNLPDIRRVK